MNLEELILKATRRALAEEITRLNNDVTRLDHEVFVLQARNRELAEALENISKREFDQDVFTAIHIAKEALRNLHDKAKK